MAGRVSDRVSASEQRPTVASIAGGDSGMAGEAESLDGLALALGVIKAQLRQPRVLIGLLVPTLVGLIGYRLGRLQGR